MRPETEELISQIKKLPEEDLQELLNVLQRSVNLKSQAQQQAASRSPVPRMEKKGAPASTEEEGQRVRFPSLFAQLFEMPLPHPEGFPHYLKKLTRTPDYAYLNEVLPHYNQWLAAAGTSLAELRKQIAAYRERIGKSIFKTDAFTALRTADFPLEQIEPLQRLKRNTDRLLVSFRIAQDHYSALKAFDRKNELPEYWAGLCQELEIPQALFRSRIFRQDVLEDLLGKAAPLQVYNHFFELLDSLTAVGIAEKCVVLIDHKEMVLDAGNALPKVLALYNGREHLQRFFRLRFFRYESLKEGGYLRTRYHISQEHQPTGEVHYRELIGHPAEEFWLLFNHYVLNDSPGHWELYFQHRNKLARWVD